MLAVHAGRLGTETRGVGSRLRAQLGEIHVGAGAIPEIHGLGKAALGVVPVEDDAVEGDSDDLDDDLDDDADQGPVLETAEQGVVDLVGVDCRTVVAHAGPSPHVLVVGAVLGVLEESGRDGPEDQAQNELQELSVLRSSTGFSLRRCEDSPIQ